MLDKTDMNKYSTMPGLLHFRHRSNQDGVCFLQRLNLQGHDFEAASSAYSFPVSSLSPLLLETKVAIFFHWVTGWLGYFQVACRLAGQYGCLSGLKHMKLQRSIFDFQPARISLIYNSLGSQKKDCELPSSDHLACNPSRIHRCAFVWCCTDGPMTNLNLSAGLPGKDERSFATELWSSPSKGSLDL